MEPRTLRLTDPVEALVVEQDLALVRQCRDTCHAAPHGQVLAQAELVALAQGRELTRRALEAVLNDAAAPAEQKGGPHGCAPAKRAARAKDKRRAAAGLVTLRLRSWLGW
jgi:hypothetical protein